MRQFLTIDTGGTKTRIVQFEDVSDSDEAYYAPVLHEAEIPTPHDGDEYIAQVADCIKQNFPDFIKSPEENVVILVTRGIVKNNILVSDTLLGWYDFDIAKELSARLGGMKIFVQNDGRLGAYGAFPPSFRGRGLYLAPGTGMGGGLMINGDPSHDIVSFEAAHMMIERNGELIEWERIASAKAWIELSGGRRGEDVPAGDPLWRQYAENLAAGIVILLPLFNPDTIVFCGKMAEFFDKYADDLRQIVAEEAWPPVAQVEIAVVVDPRHTINRGALMFGLKQMEEDDKN